MFILWIILFLLSLFFIGRSYCTKEKVTFASICDECKISSTSPDYKIAEVLGPMLILVKEKKPSILAAINTADNKISPVIQKIRLSSDKELETKVRIKYEGDNKEYRKKCKNQQRNRKPLIALELPRGAISNTNIEDLISPCASPSQKSALKKPKQKNIPMLNLPHLLSFTYPLKSTSFVPKQNKSVNLDNFQHRFEHYEESIATVPLLTAYLDNLRPTREIKMSDVKEKKEKIPLFKKNLSIDDLEYQTKPNKL